MCVHGYLRSIVCLCYLSCCLLFSVEYACVHLSVFAYTSCVCVAFYLSISHCVGFCAAKC